MGVSIMIPDDILVKLSDLNNIKQILQKANAKGYKTVMIFKPVIESQMNNLHFLVIPDNPNVSLFNQGSLSRHIKKILGFENVIVENESTLTDVDKPRIIGERCLLSENNIGNIKHFCEEHLSSGPKINSQIQPGKVIFTIEVQTGDITAANQRHYIDQATPVIRDDLQRFLTQALHGDGLKPV
jgi:hypothetical protein